MDQHHESHHTPVPMTLLCAVKMFDEHLINICVTFLIRSLAKHNLLLCKCKRDDYPQEVRWRSSRKPGHEHRGGRHCERAVLMSA